MYRVTAVADDFAYFFKSIFSRIVGLERAPRAESGPNHYENDRSKEGLIGLHPVWMTRS